jgi:hypothetical protein
MVDRLVLHVQQVESPILQAIVDIQPDGALGPLVQTLGIGAHYA